MSNPFVSWHCVTFDRPDLLPGLVECFRNQTYPFHFRELVIINDQANITYHCEDENVHVFNIKERFKSLGAKRNFAMDQCKGEFVLITDDDDIYLPNHTEHLVTVHQKTTADIVRDKFCFDETTDAWVERRWGLNQSSLRKTFVDENKFNEIYNAGEDVDLIKRGMVYINENTPTESTCIRKLEDGMYHMSCHDDDIYKNKKKQQKLFERTIRHQRYKEKLDVIL
jgi:glycosyltransferase involved in cell wall biosynthesis